MPVLSKDRTISLVKRRDFTSRIDAFGYSIYYLGAFVVGAGTNRNRTLHWRHRDANVRDYRQSVEVQIRRFMLPTAKDFLDKARLRHEGTHADKNTDS